jgi:hypothetical protein
MNSKTPVFARAIDAAKGDAFLPDSTAAPATQPAASELSFHHWIISPDSDSRARILYADPLCDLQDLCLVDLPPDVRVYMLASAIVAVVFALEITFALGMSGY